MFLNDQGAIDWNAVSAVSTAVAAIIALLTSGLALKAPEWSRKAERRDTTHEVLRAVEEAMAVYREAAKLVENGSWAEDLMFRTRIKASHLYGTLDRLIGRPCLTDGAIAVGTGAISVLAAVIGIPSPNDAIERAMPRSSAPMPATANSAKVVIDAVAEIVKIVEERSVRVKLYSIRPWWHRYKMWWRCVRTR